MSPLGRVTFRAIDHQSTMGAYLGRTKLEGQKGVMVDYVYIDGAKVPAQRRRGEEAARPGLGAVPARSPPLTFSSIVLQVLTGLASASALFLVGSGLSLIFGVTRIVNFAHGWFYMLGLYVRGPADHDLRTPARSAGGAG